MSIRSSMQKRTSDKQYGNGHEAQEWIRFSYWEKLTSRSKKHGAFLKVKIGQNEETANMSIARTPDLYSSTVWRDLPV